MTIRPTTGDEFVRHAEPIELRKDRNLVPAEWVLTLQLDKQKLFVGLRDIESLKRLGALVAKALKEASRG